MISYLNSLNKFLSCEIRQDFSHQECIKDSYTPVETEMLGKNGISINTQMTMFMPTMNTVCYDIEIMQQGHNLRVEESAQVRSNLTKKLNQSTFHSLSSIKKLPREINPANTNKICSYAMINENEQDQKKDMSHATWANNC